MLNRKTITPAGLIAAVVISIILSVGVTLLATGVEDRDKESLYQAAIADAVLAEEDEIMPLVEITAKDQDVIWNDAKDRVLLLNFNRYPDSYPQGEEAKIEWGYVWTTSAGEFLKWYSDDSNTKGVEDWNLRINQLLGMEEDSANTHMTAMWVDPAYLIRPAYNTDVREQTGNEFDSQEPEDEDYITWFNENAVYSYCENTFPWTRLGYTYDWADNGKEYGLSEFLVKDGTVVEVEFTKSLDDFIDWAEDNRIK